MFLMVDINIDENRKKKKKKSKTIKKIYYIKQCIKQKK